MLCSSRDFIVLGARKSLCPSWYCIIAARIKRSTNQINSRYIFGNIRIAVATEACIDKKMRRPSMLHQTVGAGAEDVSRIRG
jgi:hypothetical protein